MGTPNSVIKPLQKIQTFAARLVLLAPRHHHSTLLLDNLHWLPISEHIKCKVACMCFNAINSSDPAYLSELLHVYTSSRTLHFFLTLFLTTWSLFEPDPLSPNSPKSLQHFAGAMGWVFDSCQGCRRPTWSPPVIFMTENRPPIICIYRHSPSNYQMFYFNYDWMIYVNGEPECKQ